MCAAVQKSVPPPFTVKKKKKQSKGYTCATHSRERLQLEDVGSRVMVLYYCKTSCVQDCKKRRITPAAVD
jgi:hypothetical protein